jgi:hypothetical protein
VVHSINEILYHILFLCSNHCLFHVFAGAGGYGYLKEWLWWTGMIMSEYEMEYEIVHGSAHAGWPRPPPTGGTWHSRRKKEEKKERKFK